MISLVVFLAIMNGRLSFRNTAVPAAETLSSAEPLSIQYTSPYLGHSMRLRNQPAAPPATRFRSGADDTGQNNSPSLVTAFTARETSQWGWRLPILWA
mmetsp:Transcript_763/g.1628  ORF Transcript_763/g.1628 Transcript_763/m.1628 type:complete len:98 (-) Transcript_763:463-756(-)